MSLHSWGRYPATENTVHTFKDVDGLRALVLGKSELIAHGNGRSYGDSALADQVVHVLPYNYFQDFDETTGVLRCRAGVLLSEIIDTFLPRGWFPAVTPGTKFITVGGAIASDVHGKNHHVVGSFSDTVEEFTLMLPDGEVVSCSHDQNRELFLATCGGMGLTGLILDAAIRLEPVTSALIDQVTIKTGNLEQTFAAFEEYHDYTYSVAWIDCLAGGSGLGRSLLMVGEHAAEGALTGSGPGRAGVPFDLPSFTLNTLTVKAFNTLYYNRVRQRVSRAQVGINSFFYPLDAVADWNRIYGRRGFTQYQFVLPLDSSFTGLEKILARIAASGKGSFLAVLKLFGKGNANYLSFPMEGYTLALDFRIEPGLFDLLDELDQIVLQYGGRIYLTKDVRVSREVFEAGYPQVETFRALRRKYGMDKKFNSLQSLRLGL
jgi:FAD/FMN-containing dehydrogenase